MPWVQAKIQFLCAANFHSVIVTEVRQNDNLLGRSRKELEIWEMSILTAGQIA